MGICASSQDDHKPVPVDKMNKKQFHSLQNAFAKGNHTENHLTVEQDKINKELSHIKKEQAYKLKQIKQYMAKNGILSLNVGNLVIDDQKPVSTEKKPDQDLTKQSNNPMDLAFHLKSNQQTDDQPIPPTTNTSSPTTPSRRTSNKWDTFLGPSNNTTNPSPDATTNTIVPPQSPSFHADKANQKLKQLHNLLATHKEEGKAIHKAPEIKVVSPSPSPTRSFDTRLQTLHRKTHSPQRLLTQKEKATEIPKANASTSSWFSNSEHKKFNLPTKGSWGIELKYFHSNGLFMIINVENDSIAKQIGIQSGDYVKSVGGDDIHEGDLSHALSFITAHKQGTATEVEVVIVRTSKNIIESLVAHNIQMPITKDVSWEFSIRKLPNSLFIIHTVVEGGVADISGIKNGDYLIEIGGDYLIEKDIEHCLSFIATHKENKRNVVLRVMRDAKCLLFRN